MSSAPGGSCFSPGCAFLAIPGVLREVLHTWRNDSRILRVPKITPPTEDSLCTVTPTPGNTAQRPQGSGVENPVARNMNGRYREQSPNNCPTPCAWLETHWASDTVSWVGLARQLRPGHAASENFGPSSLTISAPTLLLTSPIVQMLGYCSDPSRDCEGKPGTQGPVLGLGDQGL